MAVRPIESPTCPVCLGEYSIPAKRICILLSCGHSLCVVCQARMDEASITRCALCRKEGVYEKIDIAVFSLSQTVPARVAISQQRLKALASPNLALYQEGELYYEAIKVLSGMVQVGKRSALQSRVHLDLALIFAHIGSMNNALLHLNILLSDRADPHYCEALFQRALLSQAKGFWDDSNNDLNAYMLDRRIRRQADCSRALRELEKNRKDQERSGSCCCLFR